MPRRMASAESFAGKSTLLKLLSRITEPATGEIRMTGRVGSLLGVGVPDGGILPISLAV